MAESLFSFGGLASGVQWQDMVDQIMALERRPVAKLETRITTLQARSKAWDDFRSRIQGLRTATTGLADTTAFRSFSTSINEATTGAAGFTLSAGEGATPGTYAIQVLDTAVREKVGGAYVADRSEALGLAGDFLVNGKAVTLEAGNTLDDVASRINAAKAGVTASVLKVDGAYRLTLTSGATGADGISLIDGGAGVLRSIGLLDATSTALKTATSNGALSDAFGDESTAIATLRGLTDPGSTTINVGGVDVVLTLGDMSLTDVRDAINAARPGTASVVDDASGNGYRLDIDGTTSLSGSATALEILGLTEPGRSATARQVQGAALAGGAALATTDLSTLGAGVGDTLILSGTTGTSAAFGPVELTITAGMKVQDVMAAIQTELTNAGSSAQVSIQGGRITVTDSQNGQNGLSLQITANNEGGGTLDFGSFDVVQEGYAREILAGRDAAFTVDGVRFSRSSNSVMDVVAGATLTLSRAGESHEATITHDKKAVTGAVKAFVDKFNGLIDYIASQSTVPEGGSRPPLHGEAALRTVQAELKSVMQAVLPAAVTDRTRLAEVGIEIQKDGRFEFDTATFEEALDADPTSVERLFGETGFTSTSRLEYIGASDATVEGTYDVTIDAVAQRASATGTAMAQTGGAPGDTDTLIIRASDTGAEYRVSLVPAQPLTTLAESIRATLATATNEKLLGDTAFYTDAAKTTAATEDTRLDALFQDTGGGTAVQAAVADGDTLTFSGTNRHGAAFTAEYYVGADDTLGDIRQAIQSQLGSDVTVTLENGRFVLTDAESGASELTLTVTSDSAAVEAFSVGTFSTTVEGRAAADIDVDVIDAGGGSYQLSLGHQEYGSAAGFNISYETGLVDIGLVAGDYAGTDVQATIGGEAVTGTGTVITGPEDTAIDGLLLEYDGVDTGALGSVTFSRGVGARLDQVFERLLGSESGSVQARIDAVNDQVPSLEDRIDAMESRLENRRQAMIRRFIAMEQAMATAQSQSSWLTAQISGLAGYSSGSDS